MLQASMNDQLWISVLIGAETKEINGKWFRLHAMSYIYGHRELLQVAHGQLPSRAPFTNIDWL